MDKVIYFKGDYFQICSTQGWEYVERRHAKGVVIIIALTKQNELVLIEQYRPTIDSMVIELPAGLVGDLPEYKDESLAEAAFRELHEETGYEAQQLTELISGPPSAGMSNEIVTFFYTDRIIKKGNGGGSGSEVITVHHVPLTEIDTFLEASYESGKQIATQVYSGLHLLGRQQQD